MKYDHQPRPDIEQHYHIRELIERQEKRSEDREYHRRKGKALEERNDIIKDSKTFCVTDFWCPKCKIDFKSMSIKEVEIDWSCPTQYIAFYKSKCDKGHWCIRLITDRQKDGYFIRSRLMAIDRGKHILDVVQPYETGYNLLYGKPK